MAVEAVVGALTEHLMQEAFTFAGEELSRIWHFKEDLERLGGELQTIQALLVDANRKDVKSAVVQLWLKKLNAVAFDAEDVMEEYKYELLGRKVEKLDFVDFDAEDVTEEDEYEPQKVKRSPANKVCCFFNPMRKLGFRYQMAQKIKDINSRLKNSEEVGRRYGLNPVELLDRSYEVNKVRVSSPSVQIEEIEGRDGDVKILVEMLVNVVREKDFGVTAIVGMGGQGKTTLAQLVYKHDEVEKHFEHKVWVCVSEDFNVQRLLTEMQESLTERNPNLRNREALIKSLQRTLHGKRYLLVLDDVWNENQQKWDDLRKDLQEIGGSEGTKVLVTTRSEKVVSTMLPCQVHHLGKLSDEDSWNLFKKRAFANGGVVETPQFVDVGRRIIKRCGGVPLAIKALGGLLYSKKDISEWLSIEKSDLWSCTEGEEVMSSIKLSYNHLPSLSLKQCFIYCSIYPKDSMMKREELIRLWISQGFLNSPQGSSLQMEDLGNEYWDILLRNSLLQELTYHDFYKCWYYKMHDIVHDLALQLSKDYCFTMNIGQDGENIEAVHLKLIPQDEKMVDVSHGISPKLRTFFLRRGFTGNGFGFEKFRFLRTLILCGDNIKQLPNSIARLKQLRYIDIGETGIRTLPPPSYKKLYNLQTLVVHLEEPSTIFLGCLINLRHIDLVITFWREDCMLVGIRHLVNLQTLPYFIVGDKEGCKIEELGPLNNLRGKLFIKGLEKVKDGKEAQEANILGKSKIDHLILCWAMERDPINFIHEDVLEGLEPHPYLKELEVQNFGDKRLPTWMTNTRLQNLVKLKLDGCHSCEQLPPLGHLPCLDSLEIVSCEKLTTLPSLQGLTSLDELEIKSAGVVSLPDMPSSLRSLHISDCDKLATLQSLQGCSSLKTLKIGLFSDELDYFPWPLSKTTTEDDPPNLYFPSLEILQLNGWPKLTSLPEQLQHLPSLKTLCINGFEKLKALPDWLGDIRSLQSLYISDCDNMEYMPSGEAMRRFTNLQSLYIINCPHLKERCERGSGPEWHKIAQYID